MQLNNFIDNCKQSVKQNLHVFNFYVKLRNLITLKLKYDNIGHVQFMKFENNFL